MEERGLERAHTYPFADAMSSPLDHWNAFMSRADTLRAFAVDRQLCAQRGRPICEPSAWTEACCEVGVPFGPEEVEEIERLQAQLDRGRDDDPDDR